MRRFETVYVGRGLVDTITLYDATTSGSVTDQVQYEYDDWGNLSKLDQDVDSVISGSGRGTFAVQYTYATATGGRQTLRRTTMTSPGGSDITYTYGSGSSTDDCASRVATVKYGASTVASYKYLGTRHVYTELNTTNFFQDPTDTVAGNYQYWDRFDRVTKSAWQKSGVPLSLASPQACIPLVPPDRSSQGSDGAEGSDDSG